MKNILSQSKLNNIETICKRYGIENYHINNDGGVDVNGFVNLEAKNLTEIPLCFNNVTSFFDCCNNKLTSMKGAPKFLSGNLLCYNAGLTTLQHFPILESTQAASMIVNGNSFPNIIVNEIICGLSESAGIDKYNVFVKYQDHFEVWENGFNENNFIELITEIEEGLR